MTRSRVSRRSEHFTESVIREMTRVAREHGALNLAQGFPDFPAPRRLKDAAAEAVHADVNQYAITWGAAPLREALAQGYGDLYGMAVDPVEHITVTCGATEAMASIFLALLDPGDEVVVFEPFYENYGPDAILCGASPVFVPLDAPDYALDPDRLRAAVSDRTRLLVLNTPNNPTGRVFTRDELEAVAEVCRKHDIIAVTDEIYEHIVYEGEHIPLATLDGMAERTVTVSGASKTFSVTGWRIGTVVAPADLTLAIRKVHDFLTVGAPAPLQEAVAVGMRELGRPYYETLSEEYRARRDVLYPALADAGFTCTRPQGAYYIVADFSQLGAGPSRDFALRLVREAGVATVPGSSFHHAPGGGENWVRFAFCKRIETLEKAAHQLRAFGGAGG